MPTPEQIRAAVQRHADYWSADDHAAWRAGFTEDATIEDPVGTPSRPLGDSKAEWDAAHGDQMRTTIELLECIPCGNEGASRLRARTRLAGRPDEIVVDYIGIWTVTDDGLISHNRTFIPEVDPAIQEAFYS